jgi:hypothetical protein
MIIQSLSYYYDILNKIGLVSSPGYSSTKVSFALVISKNGDLMNIVDLRTDGKKKQSIAQTNRFANNDMWNNGLTKDTDERVRKYAKSISKTRKERIASGEIVVSEHVKFKKGRLSWNNGLTKEIDNRIRIKLQNLEIKLV